MNYVTSHKGPCLTAAFSRDGKLAASGSADSCIKVYMYTHYTIHFRSDLVMFRYTEDGEISDA